MLLLITTPGQQAQTTQFWANSAYSHLKTASFGLRWGWRNEGDRVRKWLTAGEPVLPPGHGTVGPSPAYSGQCTLVKCRCDKLEKGVPSYTFEKGIN